jgi:hypothetical protein
MSHRTIFEVEYRDESETMFEILGINQERMPGQFMEREKNRRLNVPAITTIRVKPSPKC